MLVFVFPLHIVVMSEKEVLERRIRIKKNKMKKTQLSVQQEEIIQELVRGHRSTFDPSFSRFTDFRVGKCLHV